VVLYSGNIADGGGPTENPPIDSTTTTSTDPYKMVLLESMNAAQYDLDALDAALAGELAMSEAMSLEIEALTAQAEADALAAQAAEDEGDALVSELFFGNPNYTIDNFPSVFKPVVEKGLFGGNAAYTALYSMLSSIGISGLVDVMESIRKAYPDISSDEMLMLLKYDKRYNEPYLKRFEGNRARIAAGLAPLDDATYLANEAAYKKIFETYGLTQFTNTTKYADFIGKNISPDEVANRVQLVYDRVNNAMPDVKKALLQFYPELTTQDLMAYALDPQNQLPALNRKIQAAEIGGAALAQSLGTSLTARTFTGAEGAQYTNIERGTIGVEAMMQSGADAQSAAKATQYVAGVLPRGEFLSSIYAGGYDQYGQLQAEQEAYQGLASAERARQRLAGRETAAFRGSAGTSRVSFASESKGLI
jgi:hypothetical protein